ncbi:hypothetical protein EDF62_2841 [Leucobacter luti]|uniref:Metallopeptidase n=1 Tax=Leucobacter luti TaxID=340320 RepID=A0A4R6RTP0_9MICO|nr:MepB family protein [Leucobacter luti]TDP90273.1 hypothetical protein EDF62_2841 [Leucobacter luti]
MAFQAFDRWVTIVGDSFGAPGLPSAEEQRGEYESGTVMLGTQRWRIRTAHVTPTKPGAFVAVWRRDAAGRTEPFGGDDDCAGLLVFVRDGEQFGVFRFAAPQLEELGVVSSARHPGKRGFRVYPSWSTGLNPQATRTQRAQAGAFETLLG